MVLFVSDMHFQPGLSRASELALVDCLRAHQPGLSQLILGGDVFDAYIEYSTLIPKGCVRFLGYLASLADSGVKISYILGNHDCWHQDYFESELGVQLCPDDLQLTWNAYRVHAEHGDAVAGTSSHRRATKWLLRHPVPGSLYRTLMPADWGMRLAHLVKRRLDARNESPNTADILRTYARGILERQSIDLVLLGHSHTPELHVWPNGIYVNAGSWRDGHQYVALSKTDIQLMHWNGQEGVQLHSAPLQSRSEAVIDQRALG